MIREKFCGKDRIARLLLVGWVLTAVVGIAGLSLRHLAAFPKPDQEEVLSRALLRLRYASGREFLVHVIYSDCSCSRSLFTHLMTRGPFPNAEEIILYVGRSLNASQAAQHSGFGFVNISASELVSSFGLEAAPVLVEFDSHGELRYAGGYYDNPAAVSALDERIHAQLSKGARVEALPVFGCAVSARLQESINPLRILSSKYSW